MEENSKKVIEVEEEKNSVEKAEKADVIVIEAEKKPGLLSRTVSAAKKVVGKVPKPVKVGVAAVGVVAGAIAASKVAHGFLGRKSTSDDVLDGDFEVVDSEEDFVSSDGDE